MFNKKMFPALTLLVLFAVCLPLISAQDAPPPVAGGGARRVQTDGGGYSFVFGGGNHLGVSVESVTRENMGGYNLRGGEPRGVAVREVSANSPAAKAGLRKNDVILRFDGEAVSSVQKLQRLINESAPEHTARLSVSRDGAEQEISVTLGKRENFAPQAFGNFKFPEGQTFNFNSDEFKRNAEEWKRNSEQWKRNSEEWKKRAKELELNSQDLLRNAETFRAQGFGNNYSLVYGGGGGRRIGITTEELTGQLADYFGVSGRGGVLVTSVRENSPAAKAGLKAGDVITEVDGTRLKSAGELTRGLSRKDEGEVTLQITRDRKNRTIKVMPERNANPTFFTPGGVSFGAPMALIAPRISTVARPALPAMPTLPAMPRVAPSAPRVPAAPRIYATPAVPARSGVWIL